MSLSFRIAAHFSFQLVRTFLPALLILTLAFAGGTLYLAERDISRLQCAPLSADGTIALSVLDDAEVTLLPEARTDGIIVGQSAYRLTRRRFSPKGATSCRRSTFRGSRC